MKLDMKRPYGVVHGHLKIAFEQDGRQFDYEGNETDGRGPVKFFDADIDATRPEELSAAELFLKNILSGGPVSKSSVYREAEANNQNWDNVKNAAGKIGVQYVKQKGMQYWKLVDA